MIGKKTDLNLNHLKAIISYPDKSQFKDMLLDYSNLEEVAKNWITSQNKINSDKTIRFFKTHNMLGSFKNYPFTDADNTLATIHIVRDPRNVITSIMNHFEMKKEEALNFMLNENLL